MLCADDEHVRGILRSRRPALRHLRLRRRPPTCARSTCERAGLQVALPGAARRARAARADHQSAGAAQRAQLAGGGRGGDRARRRRCGHPAGAREFPGHRPAAAAARRDSLAGRAAPCIVDDYGASSDRGGGDTRGGAPGLAVAPPGARLPAASLHPHARPARRLRHGARASATCCWSPRSMPPARRRSPAPTGARSAAPCARAGSVEPVFVERVDELAEALRRRAARRRRGADHGRRQHRRRRAGAARAASRRERRHERRRCSAAAIAPEFAAARAARRAHVQAHLLARGRTGGSVLHSARRAWISRRSSASCPPSMPLLWIGLGSNLLVRDGGVRGAVVSHPRRARRARAHRAPRASAPSAGVPCARIARQCVKWGLGPAEFFAGIPGTLGGALAMNAGAWGGETWRHVVEVEMLDRRGVRHTRTPRRLRDRLPPRARAAPTNGSSPRGWSSSASPGANDDRHARAARSGAGRRSRSANGAAARCSPTRRAIMRRA